MPQEHHSLSDARLLSVASWRSSINPIIFLNSISSSWIPWRIVPGLRVRQSTASLYNSAVPWRTWTGGHQGLLPSPTYGTTSFPWKSLMNRGINPPFAMHRECEAGDDSPDPLKVLYKRMFLAFARGKKQRFGMICKLFRLGNPYLSPSLSYSPT